MTETRPLAAYVGSSEAGYKVAYCQRDTAMYLAILLVAIAMLVVGRRLPRLSLRLYLVLILPLVVDGLTQLAGLRESTWLLRTLTGGLFGLGSALLLLPEVDRAIQDVAQGYERRLHGPG